MIAREIRLEDGKLLILSEPWFMLPVKIFVETTKEILKEPKHVLSLYYTAKKGNKTSMSKTLKNRYIVRGRKFIDLAIDMTKMGGWGLIKTVTADEENGHVIFNIYNSAIGMNYGRSKKPVDHVWRGILAGGISVAFDKDIDFVETDCIAQGKAFCIFVGKPRKEWFKTPTKLVREQLGSVTIQ